jgi:hypothetical protein
VQRGDATVDEGAAAPLGETAIADETLTDLTEPLPDDVKAAADAEYRERSIRAAGNPADKAASDLLLTAVKNSPHRDLIVSWVQEGNRAGAAWSLRKTPTVLNFERLRMALELAETLGSEKLVALLLERTLVQAADIVGELIGRMTVEDCINALTTVHRIGFDLHVRYAADGEPTLVAR